MTNSSAGRRPVDAIARKGYPSWRLEMQIMRYEDAANYRFNPFDVTKVWPHEDYPPIPVGRFVLDRNPANFFAQIVQAGFDVANFVPGIGPSPDRMVLGRMFAYADSNRYRSGPNYAQLPVNRPLDEVHNYKQGRPDALPPQWEPVGLRAQQLRRAHGPSVVS
jgi:catalase